jgi:hypothetical protein
MIKSPYRRRSINLDDGSHERCKILADDMSLSISGFLRVLICKIADNSDPLRGIFAFNSDPF